MADLAARHAPSAVSQIAAVYDRVRDPLATATPYAKAAAHLVRSEGEALVTGAGLALLKNKVLGGSLDYKGWAVDGILAALASAASLTLATGDDGLSVDARNVAGNLTALCAFRKTEEYLASKRGQAPNPHGEHHGDHDTLLAAAAELV